jgi:plasmid stabilization system protein ParE
MTIEFLPIAKAELDDAVEYYELELSGLGARFKEEVKFSVKRIAVFPKAWSVIRPDIRKCIMHKFPYNILYTIEENLILILAPPS